jgi:hypothetical protein
MADIKELLETIARLHEEIAEVVSVAHKHGWNGIENSKLLHRFLDNLLTEQQEEIERLKNLLNLRDATGLALSLKAESWETAAFNARDRAEKAEAERDALKEYALTLVNKNSSICADNTRLRAENEDLKREFDRNCGTCAWCNGEIYSQTKRERDRLRVYVGNNDLQSDYRSVNDMRQALESLKAENERLKRSIESLSYYEHIDSGGGQ